MSGRFDPQSGLVLYQQDGGTVRTAEAKLREQFSVTDFFEVADADETPAFRRAIAKQQAGFSSASISGVGTSLSNVVLQLPAGIYRLSGNIDNGVPMNGLRIIGEGAIIELDPGVTFCDNIRYFFYMSGVTIRGGAKHIGIKTGNNECQIILENCQLMYPSNRIFDLDATSQSTQLLIKNCRLFTDTLPAAKILVALSGDYIVFEDCFIKTETVAASAIDVTNVHLSFIRTVGVPVNLHSWVTLRGQGCSFYSDPLCRFGGEFGGTTWAVLLNYIEAYTFQEQLTNTIHIDGSHCFSLGPLIHFFAIPNQVIIENCLGLPGTHPLKVDASVTAAQLSRIGEMNSIFRVMYNGHRYGPYIDPFNASPIAREGLPLVEDRMMLSGIPDVADLVLQSGGYSASYAPSNGATNVTLASTTDQFDVPIQTMTATVDNGLAAYYFLSALDGLPAGVYTAVFDIELPTSTAINVEFRAGNTAMRKQFVPTRGRHTICLPFYYDGVGATGYLPKALAIDVLSMPNGAVLRWHRFRIYNGRRHITGPTVEVYGTAAPTTGQWYRGDKILNTAKTRFGLPNFWMCLVAGSPGVFAADVKTGFFQCAAAVDTVVAEPEFRTDGATYFSAVKLIATNAAAAALMGSAKHLILVGYNNGVGFTVGTGNSVAALGTETFQYALEN